MSTIKIVPTNYKDTEDLNKVVSSINKFGITGIIDFEIRSLLLNLAIDDESWQKLSLEQQQFYCKNISKQMLILTECRNEIAVLLEECKDFQEEQRKLTSLKKQAPIEPREGSETSEEIPFWKE